MASLASQLVFHPAVSQSLKLGATTLGRDKLYRAIQNFARAYAFLLLTRGDKEASLRWTALKGHLGTARKLMRLGKPIEHLQAALRAALDFRPATEQITTIARQVSYFGYLTFDAFVWAHSVKFITLQPETAQRVSKLSNRFWLAGILFSILHGTAKTYRLSAQAKRLSYSEKFDLGQEADRVSRHRALEVDRANTRQQLVIDVLDSFLPASALGYSSLNDGVLGTFGFITSMLALQKQWDSLKK